MINSTYKIKGQLISMAEHADGLKRVLVTIRDHDGTRQEVGQWGALTLHCGDELILSSEGMRDQVESATGLSAVLMDREGGQDSGVWLWNLPEGATGHLSIEADWLASLRGGTVELLG